MKYCKENNKIEQRMNEKYKRIYDEYIGWIVLVIIIFPIGIVLDIKFLQAIRKLRNK